MWWSFFSTTLPYFEAVFLPFKQFPELGIDIRRKVLIAYRDYVILPLYPRLEGKSDAPSI
jgi:HbrB-like